MVNYRLEESGKVVTFAWELKEYDKFGFGTWKDVYIGKNNAGSIN
jgi:hypothetical protein